LVRASIEDHFTEVFTARILGMKMETLYDYLVNYRPNEVKKFYETVETITDEEIAHLIQLPYPFERFELEEDQIACKKAVRITKNLNMISKFFLKHYLLINLYEPRLFQMRVNDLESAKKAEDI